MNNVIVLERYSPGRQLTVKQAAGELNVTEATLRNYLSAGIFTTYKFGNMTLLSWDEVFERAMKKSWRADETYY